MTLKLTALVAATGLALVGAPARAADEKAESKTEVEQTQHADGTTEKKVDKKVKHTKKKGMKTSKKHVEDKTTTDAQGNTVEHQHTEK